MIILLVKGSKVIKEEVGLFNTAEVNLVIYKPAMIMSLFKTQSIQNHSSNKIYIKLTEIEVEVDNHALELKKIELSTALNPT